MNEKKLKKKIDLIIKIKREANKEEVEKNKLLLFLSGFAALLIFFLILSTYIDSEFKISLIFSLFFIPYLLCFGFFVKHFLKYKRNLKKFENEEEFFKSNKLKIEKVIAELSFEELKELKKTDYLHSTFLRDEIESFLLKRIASKIRKNPQNNEMDLIDLFEEVKEKTNTIKNL